LSVVIGNVANITRVSDPAQGVQPALISSAVSFVVAIGAYLWMILGGEGIAAMIVSRDRKVASGGTVSKRDLHVIAFSAIGLTILGRTIPRLAELLLAYLAYVSPIPRPIRYPTHLPTQLLRTCIQLTLGLYVFLGAPGLVELVNRFANQLS